MPPLPTLWDPAGAVDKLPQPFRMIDKILADIVEQVVDLIGKREQQRKLEEAAKVNLTFAPHAVMEVPPETAKFLPIGIAGLAAVALPDGELRVHSARDAGSSFSDTTTHAGHPVTALEAGMVVSTSGRLLAAASRATLSLHEVDIKTCQLTLLATVPLPQDPDDPSCPVRIHWSLTLGHLAVCYGSGALVLLAVRLPVPNVSMEAAGAFLSLSLSAFGATRVEEVLRVPLGTVRAFCLGSPTVGPSHVVWQLQQRPDKGPHSDRYHKSARGAYVWWEGAGRLLLIDLPAAAARAASGAAAQPPGPADAESSSLSSKPSAQPPSKSLSTKGGPVPPSHGSSSSSAEASAASGPVATTCPPAGEPPGPPRLPPISPLARDWLFPHHITAAAATSDYKTMAWGLANGSVVLWDDRSCCAPKVLPRLKGAITALAWVNGVAHKLMCASAAGNIFIADIIKPEDSSQKPYEFPQPVHAIHFLPNEPFALCICRGHTSTEGQLAAGVTGSSSSSSGGAAAASGAANTGPGGLGGSGLGLGGAGGVSGGVSGGVAALRPRIVWFNVLEEKPVAELMGPQAGQSFGLACCVPVAPPPPPPPAEDAETEDPQAAAAAQQQQGSAASSPSTSPTAAVSTANPGPAPAVSAGRQSVLHTLQAMAASAAAGPMLVPVPLALPPGEAVEYPCLALQDTYLVVGGDVVDKVVHSNFADADAVPARVTRLYMYKVDALLRHLLPEDEMHSRLGKVVLDRLLADLEAPKVSKRKGKRVTMDLEDPDAPKLPSSMRKPDPFDPSAGSGRASARAANRHITFGSGSEELFDDSGGGSVKKFPKETKVYPKETKKGLKAAPDDINLVNKDRRGLDGKPRLAPLGLEKAKEDPQPFAERSQSPPWHHTNPLARIHPDWEEAPVLIRIMERIGSKGGGRKRRDKRLDGLMGEMMGKYAKEAGPRPNLLVS